MTPPETATCPGHRGDVLITNADDRTYRLDVTVARQPDGPVVLDRTVDVDPDETVRIAAIEDAGSYDVDVRLVATGEAALASAYAGRFDCVRSRYDFRVTQAGELVYRGSVVFQ